MMAFQKCLPDKVRKYSNGAVPKGFLFDSPPLSTFNAMHKVM